MCVKYKGYDRTFGFGVALCSFGSLFWKAPQSYFYTAFISSRSIFNLQHVGLKQFSKQDLY